MSARVLFPFRSSFYFFSIRVGSLMVFTGDGLLSLVRLALVLTRVELFDKEHRFINMDVQQSRIRYSILFGLNLLASQLLGVGIVLSECRPVPVLMVPWLVMFLCCTWLYYPNIIYHKKQSGPIAICVLIMALCLYCWSVVLSFFLQELERSSPSSDRSVVTGAAAKPLIQQDVAKA